VTSLPRQHRYEQFVKDQPAYEDGIKGHAVGRRIGRGASGYILSRSRDGVSGVTNVAVWGNALEPIEAAVGVAVTGRPPKYRAKLINMIAFTNLHSFLR
jgi:hypothetical protein